MSHLWVRGRLFPDSFVAAPSVPPSEHSLVLKQENFIKSRTGTPVLLDQLVSSRFFMVLFCIIFHGMEHGTPRAQGNVFTPPLDFSIRVLESDALFSNLFIQVELSNYLYESLCSVPNIRIYGPMPSRTFQRAALCSFNVEGIHPTDIATLLDQQVCCKNKYGFLTFIFCEFCIIKAGIDAVGIENLGTNL